MRVHIVGKRRESLHLKVTQLVDEPAGKAYIFTQAADPSVVQVKLVGDGWLVWAMQLRFSQCFLSAYLYSFWGKQAACIS